MRLCQAAVAAISLFLLFGLATAQISATPPNVEVHPRVRALKVTILSTMLADQGIGEWGFSALVEADGHRILVDTGNRPETVLQNANELGIDLSTVSEVVLTHNHDDHVGGLLTLRRELMKKNPSALSRVHVARGIFYSRPSAKGESNTMIAIKGEYEATGERSSSMTTQKKFSLADGSPGRFRACFPSVTGVLQAR
jgi:7,8-dihydropterin-6-yl-methyl-4-(beta-D-ribofuranosyl)aminobenzene 5'-phosphate synthase